jgi:predicted transcriptional regulator
MQPTTLKIPPELKARVAALAADAGKTVHAFLLQAIEEQTTRAERRRQFVAAALAAEAQVTKDGKVFPMEAVHRHLRERAAGRKSTRPKAVSWRK